MFLTDFASDCSLRFCDAQWQEMKIGPGFAAVEGRFLWRVDKNLQAVFDLAGGREVDEAIVAGVKTADEAGDDACGSCAG